MGLKHRLGLLVCLLAGLTWLAVYAHQMGDRLFEGGNDFLQLYAGAKLVGTPELYEPEAAWRIHREAVGYRLPAVVYTRPPFYAWMLQPLGWLPYPAAYRLFMFGSLAGICWFCWRFFQQRPATALLVSCFPPLYVAVLGGNDLGLVLSLFAGALILMEKERDFAAGLLLSMCAIKPHLFCLLPAVLWILGRRRVLAGGVMGGAVLAAISFLAQGPAWPWQYLALLRSPLIHPQIQAMPNLHGLMFSFLPAVGSWATAVVSGVVAAATLWLVWRDRRDWRAGVGYAVLGSLLVSWHCYIQDAVLLLPVLALLQKGGEPAAVRLPLAITFLPFTFWMLSAQPPWSGLPALAMSGILAGAIWQSVAGRPLSVVGTAPKRQLDSPQAECSYPAERR